MDLNHNSTELVRAGDVKIPDIYYRRLKTGNEHVDSIFGDGILPGCTITVDATAGTGKSSLLLQLCQMLSVKGHKTAFLSGEENIYMVALNARRLEANDVLIATESRLSRLIDTIKNNDLVVIDSFPSVVYDGDDADEKSKSEKEKIKLETIVSAAQKNETAVCIVLHVTKTGTYKGDSTIQHAVDVNVTISKNADDFLVRDIEVVKNRTGCCGLYSFTYGSKGYDFSTIRENVADDDKKEKTSTRSENRNAQLEAILNIEGDITITEVMDSLDIDAQRAMYLLWLLVKSKKLEKHGRGDSAFWLTIE